MVWLTFWAAAAGRVRDWALVEVGPGRLVPWLAVAFGCGIVVYFAAEREPALWAAIALAGRGCRARRPGAAPAGRVSGDARHRRGGRRFCGRDGQARHRSRIRCCRRRSGTWRSRASSRCARSASAPTASSCGSSASPARASTRSSSACGCRCARARRRRSAASSSSRRGCRRRSSRCGRAATTSRATCISSASARPASCSAASGPRSRSGAVALAALRHRHRRHARGDRQAHPRGRARRQGAIASALITGKRDAISPPVNDAMYVSGLGHVLSISGYHMAVVAGIVFFVLRALFALMPAFAGRHPIKKWAALAALVRGGVLSAAVGRRGRDAALLHHDRDRADRRDGRSADADAAHADGGGARRAAAGARSGRASELPDVVCRDAGAGRRLPAGLAVDEPAAPTRRSARASRCGAGARSSALIIVSLLAGTRDHAYAAYHFHRISPYGVLANLLAMPVVSAWVMPMGILGVLAMPFGLDGLLLVADGRRHRLDGRGRALGHESSGRGRPHGGVRHRAAAGLHAPVWSCSAC